MKSVKSAIQTNDIAFGDTSVASAQAKSILELINDTIYIHPFQDIDTSGGGSSKRGEAIAKEETKAAIEVSSLSYKLIPTLIEGQMAGYLQLGPDESGYLQVYDLFGQEIRQFKITEGVNNIPLGEILKQSGIYVYQVTISNQVKRTDKIIKVQ